MTQAELSRHVRALVTSLQKSGLTVAGVKVTFVQGVPAIEVTTGPESPLSAPVSPGGDNVEELKERVARLHARRS